MLNLGPKNLNSFQLPNFLHYPARIIQECFISVIQYLMLISIAKIKDKKSWSVVHKSTAFKNQTPSRISTYSCASY